MTLDQASSTNGNNFSEEIIMSVSTDLLIQSVLPVTVGTPTDAQIAAQNDARHFPNPVSTLEASLINAALPAGFSLAGRTLAMPLAAVRVASQDDFVFTAFAPIVPRSSAEAKLLEVRTRALLKSELPVLLDRWNDELRPAGARLATQLAEIDFVTA